MNIFLFSDNVVVYLLYIQWYDIGYFISLYILISFKIKKAYRKWEMDFETDLSVFYILKAYSV